MKDGRSKRSIKDIKTEIESIKECGRHKTVAAWFGISKPNTSESMRLRRRHDKSQNRDLDGFGHKSLVTREYKS